MANLTVEGQFECSTLGGGVTSLVKSIILDNAYPVGSIYLSLVQTSPASILGGEWEALADGYTLWTTTAEDAGGETIAAGLPNITGTVTIAGNTTYSSFTASGAFASSDTSKDSSYGHSTDGRNVTFDASSSDSIYGSSSTVQPPAIKVYMWKRIA